MNKANPEPGRRHPSPPRVVTSGTGAYANLRGQGLRAATVHAGIVTETLTGDVHFD